MEESVSLINSKDRYSSNLEYLSIYLIHIFYKGKVMVENKFILVRRGARKLASDILDKQIDTRMVSMVNNHKQYLVAVTCNDTIKTKPYIKEISNTDAAVLYVQAGGDKIDLLNGVFNNLLTQRKKTNNDLKMEAL